MNYNNVYTEKIMSDILDLSFKESCISIKHLVSKLNVDGRLLQQALNFLKEFGFIEYHNPDTIYLSKDVRKCLAQIQE